MQEIRVLLVEDNAELRESTSQYLARQEGVKTVREASNGIEALTVLTKETTDIMVTDLIMPHMDGFELLDEITRLELTPTPKIIAATALSRDDFVLRAIERGVMYYMVKPFDYTQLYGRILDIMSANGGSLRPAAHAFTQAKREQTLDERLSALFLTMGIPAHIKGYAYLREAVKMVVNQPDVINRITKELYPGICKKFDTSASRVERAIRHAIEVAWSRGRIETLNRAFGYRVCTKEDKPTNGEFIAMLADKFSLERRSA